jgi:major membrane immunogen (membrane-anchored lipoprotein)
MTRRHLWLVLCGAALLVGCSKNDDLSEVTGVVTLDDRPLADAMIVFSPVGNGTTSYGRSDSEGKYRMLFRDNEYGAWLGENIVRITTFDLGGKKEQVPIVYNSRSTLKVEVKPGENVHNFQLKSDAGKIVQGPSD